MMPRNVKNVDLVYMNSIEHMKIAAFQELQEALKIKRINDQLLEFLASSLRWIIHYAKKNNMDIPDREKIIALIDRAMEVEDKLPTSSPKNKHPSTTPKDSTEPKILIPKNDII